MTDATQARTEEISPMEKSNGEKELLASVRRVCGGPVLRCMCPECGRLQPVSTACVACGLALHVSAQVYENPPPWSA